MADTPSGAWAEFLRHEEIVDEVDLAGVSRAIWAIRIDDEDFASPALPDEAIRGGTESYAACQEEAARLRGEGAVALRTRSAALRDGAAGGWRVELGMRPGEDADGQVIVLFGARPHAIGWMVVDRGRPPAELLPLVRRP